MGRRPRAPPGHQVCAETGLQVHPELDHRALIRFASCLFSLPWKSWGRSVVTPAGPTGFHRAPAPSSLSPTAAGPSAERPRHCWCRDTGRRARGHFRELHEWKQLRGRNGAWPISEDGKAVAGQGAGAILGDPSPRKTSERKGKVLSLLTQ